MKIMSDKQSKPPYQYFLKGDISGIQEFIFNVKSSGAARALKGRSFFIQAISMIGLKMVVDKIGADNIEIFYNGGGNFYLMAKDFSDEQLDEIQTQIDQTCRRYNFYLSISKIPIQSDKPIQENFGFYWKKLNLQAERDKLQKFRNHLLGFEPYYFEENRKNFDWKGITKFIRKINTFDITTLAKTEEKTLDLKIDESGVLIFNHQLTKGDTAFKNIVRDLPTWSKDLINNYQHFIQKEMVKRLQKGESLLKPQDDIILEFSYLSGFAAERTGTNKLGILKMDVDSLGGLFSHLNYDQAKKVSKKISDFFGSQITTMLSHSIPNADINKAPVKFADNIYPVFSGGDDCFFVGGWDAIMYWAKLIQQEFNEVAQQLERDIQEDFKANGKRIPATLAKLFPISISGAIVMLESTYPTTRFANLAQEALDVAKYFTYPTKKIATKNKINCLGEVLNWLEYNATLELADELKSLVNEKGEPRSTLEKIRSTAKGYKLMYEEVSERRMGPSIAHLFYFIRHSKNQKVLADKLVKPFSMDLISAFTKPEETESNPLKYPLAARIAEFLTR